MKARNGKDFLSAWVEAIGESAKTCKEVAAILKANPRFASTLPDNLQDVLKDPEKSFAKSLGRALARKEKRPYGENNLALQRDKSHKGQGDFVEGGPTLTRGFCGFLKWLN